MSERFRFGLLLLAVFLLGSLLRSQTSQALPLDGNYILGQCKYAVQVADRDATGFDTAALAGASWCTGYVTGIKELLQTQRMMMNPKIDGQNGPLGICIPYQLANDQTTRIIVKWLKSHPEKLHLDGAILTPKILAETFPCRSEKGIEK